MVPLDFCLRLYVHLLCFRCWLYVPARRYVLAPLAWSPAPEGPASVESIALERGSIGLQVCAGPPREKKSMFRRARRSPCFVATSLPRPFLFVGFV
eukprot:SAG22_NODE_837_length_6911_cov_4.576629_7_plen_96_part_00